MAKSPTASADPDDKLFKGKSGGAVANFAKAHKSGGSMHKKASGMGAMSKRPGPGPKSGKR